MLMTNISYSNFQFKDESFVLLFRTHFISLDQDKYYISFSDYRNNRAMVSTSANKFCQLFHMHPIS